MLMSRRVSGFLIAFGVWSWWIWLTFARNLDRDAGRSTAFYVIHAVLIVASLAWGTAIGVIGLRGWRAAGRARATHHEP